MRTLAPMLTLFTALLIATAAGADAAVLRSARSGPWSAAGHLGRRQGPRRRCPRPDPRRAHASSTT